MWRRLPRASGLDPRERAVARELAAWRERMAEREDRPVGSILRDPSVVELAKRKPADTRALGNIRGVTPDVVRRRGRDIVAAIERGRAAPPIKLDAEERLGSDSGDGPVIALAESLVRARALEAGLAYELIAARADLSPVVVSVRRGLEPPGGPHAPGLAARARRRGAAGPAARRAHAARARRRARRGHRGLRPSSAASITLMACAWRNS